MEFGSVARHGNKCFYALSQRFLALSTCPGCLPSLSYRGVTLATPGADSW
eukprot:COSAG02_NODE_3509_length_6634_cov_2.750574_7_plen_50_part_00